MGKMLLRAFLACYLVSVSHGLSLPYIGWKLPSFQFPSLEMNSNMIPSMFEPDDPIPQMDDYSNPEQLIDREFNMPEIPTYQYAFKLPNLNATGNGTSTNRTVKHKDGFKIVTTETKFPGGESVVQTMEKEGIDNKTGKSFTLAKMLEAENDAAGKINNFSPGVILKNCKNCGENQFCDPTFRTCQKKLVAGSRCAMKNQCQKGLLCIWGKCNKGKEGDAGTFCKKKGDCNGESCCIKRTGQMHALCTPLGSENAICGSRIEGFLNLFQTKFAKGSCEPCKKGLKCAATGDSIYQRCLPEAFVEIPFENKPKEKDEDKEQSNEKDNDKDDGSSDDNSDGSKDDGEDKSKDDSSDNEQEQYKLKTDSSGKIPIKPGPKKGKSSKGSKDSKF